MKGAAIEVVAVNDPFLDVDYMVTAALHVALLIGRVRVQGAGQGAPACHQM